LVGLIKQIFCPQVNLEKWVELNQIELLITNMQDTETVNEITTVIAEMRKNHSIRQLLELVTSMLIQSLAQEI